MSDGIVQDVKWSSPLKERLSASLTLTMDERLEQHGIILREDFDSLEPVELGTPWTYSKNWLIFHNNKILILGSDKVYLPNDDIHDYLYGHRVYYVFAEIDNKYKDSIQQLVSTSMRITGLSHLGRLVPKVFDGTLRPSRMEELTNEEIINRLYKRHPGNLSNAKIEELDNGVHRLTFDYDYGTQKIQGYTFKIGLITFDVTYTKNSNRDIKVKVRRFDGPLLEDDDSGNCYINPFIECDDEGGSYNVCIGDTLTDFTGCIRLNDIVNAAQTLIELITCPLDDNGYTRWRYIDQGFLPHDDDDDYNEDDDDN